MKKVEIKNEISDLKSQREEIEKHIEEMNLKIELLVEKMKNYIDLTMNNKTSWLFLDDNKVKKMMDSFAKHFGLKIKRLSINKKGYWVCNFSEKINIFQGHDENFKSKFRLSVYDNDLLNVFVLKNKNKCF